KLIDTLANQENRLLTIIANAPLAGESYVELAHEALIQNWATLREWVAKDRDGRRLHARLRADADHWRQLNQDPDALYRGLILMQAEKWLKDHPTWLTKPERYFLEASRAEQTREENEKRAQELYEIALANKVAATESRRAALARRA